MINKIKKHHLIVVKSRDDKAYSIPFVDGSW